MTARCSSAGIVSELSGGLSAHCQKRSKKAVKKVGNVRKRVEKRLGR
jgi:hypothetical protein